MSHPRTLLLHAECPGIQSSDRDHQMTTEIDRIQKNTGEPSLQRRAACSSFTERRKIHSFSAEATREKRKVWQTTAQTAGNAETRWDVRLSGYTHSARTVQPDSLQFYFLRFGSDDIQLLYSWPIQWLNIYSTISRRC
ncbi:hypothetical protein F2P79_006404 [Pimephales promelas]|nr:hypothetical protein F2P79_006404 [Pimephales promelas]